MPRKKTTEEFIKESVLIHGDKYDYSLVDYKNNKTKVGIICQNHGMFYQLPKYHLGGSKCPKCSKKKYVHEEFINRCKDIHGDKYNYITNYINSKKKIKIVCKECNKIIEILPNNHLNGQGCKKCNLSRSLRYTTDKFKQMSIKIHEDKYDYSLVEYINSKSKVKIICPHHGVFNQEPSSHLRGNGCVKCRNEKYKNEYRKTTDYFISRSKEKHGDKYDYSLVEYLDSKNTVKIICHKHGEFNQLPHNHLSGSGCNMCKSSKGEKKIFNSLNIKNIDFITQKKFKKCKSKNGNFLFFDFYIPKLNLIIEYDGRHHYEAIDKWGGQEELCNQIERDKIKNNYCIKNNINLLRIPYWDYGNIDKILNEII